MITPAVTELAALSSTKQACALLGKPRASHYRAQQVPSPGPPRPAKPAPPNALSAVERAEILATLNRARFADKSVAQTWGDAAR